MVIERYNHLNKYLKNKFGERTLKVCVDGGFTCPNRDGSKGIGGCIFCSALGSGDNIKYRQEDIFHSIESQVAGFLNSYRGERANKFIVYFQSFTNTYDNLENLKNKFDIALGVSDKIVGLEVATRPDCITEDVAKLLSSYKDKYYVCVELGLQTVNDEVGKLINRCYNTQDFIVACEVLRKYDIDVVAHLMVGLPNEKFQDILNTVKVINACRCKGIKIHSTYVVKGTKLNDMYCSGEYEPITMEYYVWQVGEIIAFLNKEIIIHRITADPPKECFVTPEWQRHKKVVLNSIESYLSANNITQGCKNEIGENKYE